MQRLKHELKRNEEEQEEGRLRCLSITAQRASVQHAL
jgi:hypothetical protein